MIFDAANINELASSHGAMPTTMEKVIRLLELLEAINKHPYLKSRLALKGGTALNLFYGKPRRLSVDLDFNYVGAVERDRMMQERPLLEQAIEMLASSQGYIVQQNSTSHAGRTWFLTYANHINIRDRIEIDVVYTNRVALLPVQLVEPWSPILGKFTQGVLLSSTEEIIAGKVRALLDRVAARDIYDVAWVTSLITPEGFLLFKRIFILMAGTLDKALVAYSADRIARISEREVDTHLRPMLMKELGPSRVMVDAAITAVTPLLDLNDSEREFGAALNRGEYRPELLLQEWPDVLERARSHPALLWKAENARKPR